METMDKLKILADSAKYDVSCSSSGSSRKNTGGVGNGMVAGCCHSFSADGRCISLLKILMTNSCIFDCKYCVNRKSNKVKRAIFTPMEIAELTINFYKRNYIEGLFLSSGIIKSPDYTMGLLYDTIYLLRNKFNFQGYIHVKTIPGAKEELIHKLGLLVDRMSVNIELPSNESLKLLAPNKKKDNIVEPMKYIGKTIKKERRFVRAGQSTQMIIGATADTDYKIMNLSESMYDKLKMKRVYYSAYVSVNKDNLLPVLKEPPLTRENRLYQADWLLRFYGFKVNELLNEENQNFNYLFDPKCNWALRNLDKFPVEINKIDYQSLIRIPGIGILSAKKIVSARKHANLTFEDLKRMRVVLKRAKYFILCDGKYYTSSKMFNQEIIQNSLIYTEKVAGAEQLTLFNQQLLESTK